jgi:predicted hydrocarbon binding protein
MHGVILLEFGRFVEARFGGPVWAKVVGRSGFSSPIFLPTQIYPDSDFFTIVSGLCQESGRDPASVLEEFGDYIVPSLASLYAAFIDADWTLLDLLEHTEATIHRVVRMRSPGAEPPRLRSRRMGPDAVEVVYESQRKLCAFARGIVRGLAKLYEEQVDLTHPECMLKGDPLCRIQVRALRNASRGGANP